MKPILIPCLLATLPSVAQWSNEPAAPMVVCNAANEQRSVRAIADADSGYYVFWSDLRNDPQKADLYGQHFDSEGNALWEANGALLLTHPTRSINQVAPLLMPDGSLIIAYIARVGTVNGDTVHAMRFDANADALWAGPTVLLGGLDYRSMQIVASDSCAIVVSYCGSCGGGGYGCRMQRVRMDGTVQFALPGQSMVSNYFGPYTVHPDGAGGILFNIRCANGAGTCLVAQRFDSLGAPVWPGYIQLADVNGVNYGFRTAIDDSGAQTAVWEVGGDLRMRRIDTLGVPQWSPEVLITSDLPTYVQADPSVLSMGDVLFVAWNDNRPPASYQDLYVQKFDLNTGAELWASDGIPAIQLSTFTPRTGMVASDSGGVVVTIDASFDGYSAMRVRSDGTLAWDGPVAFCTPTFNPVLDERVHLSDGDGGVVAFWKNTAGDVYGGRIYRNGKRYNDVGIGGPDKSTTLGVFPNPATDFLHLDLRNDQRILRAEVINAQGQVTVVAVSGRSVDVRGLAQGSYIARIHTNDRVSTTRFIKH